jgi:hypothetical protein
VKFDGYICLAKELVVDRLALGLPWDDVGQ